MSQNILNDYQIKETIGKGTFSKVKLGINKSTGEKVAIKILDKRKIMTRDDQIRVQRELTILKKINHLNIVKIIQTKEDQGNVYIITEFIDYDLFLHIINNKRLDEKEAALYYFQLISGLEYIHSLNIVHRDLKPENLLLTKRRVLKIIDFGLSNYFYGDKLLVTPCGSPSYTCPELIKGYKYNGFAVDIWTSGIILYVMLCGFLPFEERDTKSLFKKIIKCKVVYPKYVSANAQNLLKRILVPNPDTRITINEIKKLPFYLDGKNMFYKRYPDLIDKLENGNNSKLNKNYSFNVPNSNKDIIKKNCFNDITINNLPISDKKQKVFVNENDKNNENNDSYKKIKEKSISPYSIYKKHLKNRANFEILKKVLRGSRADSIDQQINPEINGDNEEKKEEEKNSNIKIKEEEKAEKEIEIKENYSPIQLIRRLNNQRQKYENKAQMTDFKDKNSYFKQKPLKENNFTTIDNENEKRNNSIKNRSRYNKKESSYVNSHIIKKENLKMSKTNTFYLNSKEKYYINEKKSNNKRNNNYDIFFKNSSKEIYNSGKYKNHKTVEDVERSSKELSNDYKSNNYKYNKYKFKVHKYNCSINNTKETEFEFFDSLRQYNKSKNSDIRMKSYIINKDSINDKKIKNKSIIKRKPKKTKSPKYSGLSEKIISFNNLYNSIQNKFENYRGNYEKKTKFENNIKKEQNMKKSQSSLENIEKSNSNLEGIKYLKKSKKFKKVFVKSEEHRKKRQKREKNDNDLKYTPSDLNKRLKTLKNSKNNSKTNILENSISKRNNCETINNNMVNISKNNKNSEKKIKKNIKIQKNIDKIDIDNKKYNLKEIIKRRGLNKNINSDNCIY